MSPHSFWTILIKTLGLYVILQALITIPVAINSVSMFTMQPMQSSSGSIYALAYSLLLFGSFGLILWECLFKTDWIINKLKLNTGFAEEKLGFTMHRSDVLKIVIMVIGGLTLLESLPIACQDLFLCLQRLNEYNGFKRDPTSIYLLYNLIKIGIGIFMVTSSRLIVNFIERKRRHPVEDKVTE